MSERTSYDHGVFSWMDLSALDMNGVKSWYEDLFGWTAVGQDTHGGPPYAMFDKGGKAVAGLGQLNDEMKAAGVPPTWNTYVTVDDVHETVKRVEANGGKTLVPAMEIPEAGWMAWFTDPEGAAFAVWKANKHIGSQLVNEHGALCWNEMYTRDTAKATEFYGAVFGWTITKMDMGPTQYNMVQVGGRDIGGIMAMNEEWGDMPAHWMVYIAVDDIKATLDKVEKSGGKVHVPPVEIPPGTFSVVADPQGANFTVIQLKQPD